MHRIPAALLALALLAGCAPLQTVSTMVPDLAGIDVARGPASAYRNAVAVGQVPAEPALFRDALGRTLQGAALSGGDAGRYRLDVTSLTLQRPYAGFAMTVTATITYRLVEAASGQVAYERTLTTPGTATLDDAVTNENRLRIADDRAIAANLQALVRDLYALPEPTRRPTSSRRT